MLVRGVVNVNREVEAAETKLYKVGEPATAWPGEATRRLTYDGTQTRPLVWRWANRLMNTRPLGNLGPLGRRSGHNVQANEDIKL